MVKTLKNDTSFETRENFWGYFTLLCVLFIIAYWFVSVDTPMHDMFCARYRHQRHDSAWFYDCGRAWMNGFIPYVEFADSKGPLLWLLYGIAYLITPQSYFGIFIINSIAYCFTLYFLLRTVRIFTENIKSAFWINIAIIPVMLCPLILYDDKSEEIALPFLAAILFITCRMIYQESGVRNQDTRFLYRDFFWAGVCAGAILLIKYSIALMSGMMFIFMLEEALRRHPGAKTAMLVIGYALAGAVTIFVPFMIYFACVGAFVAFFDEYFYQTLITIINLSKADRGHATLTRFDVWSYILLLVSGSLLAPLWLKRNKWFPLLTTLCMLLVLGSFARTYYYIPCHIMMIFTVLSIYHGIRIMSGTEKAEFNFMPAKTFGAIACALPLLLTAVFFGANKKWYNGSYLYDRASTHERRCAKMCAEVIGEKHNARLLCYNIGNHGYGIFAEALPACKYFGIQGGATPAMRHDQDSCVNNRLADFIVVAENDKMRQQRIEAHGYVLRTSFKNWHHRIYQRQD